MNIRISNHTHTSSHTHYSSLVHASSHDSTVSHIIPHHITSSHLLSSHTVTSDLTSCTLSRSLSFFFLQDRYISKVMSGTEGGVSSSSSVSVLSSRSYKCRLNMPVRQSEFSSNAICCCCYMLATVHTVARVAYSPYMRINTSTIYMHDTVYNLIRYTHLEDYTHDN